MKLKKKQETKQGPPSFPGTSPLDNSRHEIFAQYVAEGNTETEAYAKVYKCEQSAARRNGARLMTNALVRARIGALKAQNARVNGLTRERKRQILADLAETAPMAIDRIRAIQEDNRMTGIGEDARALPNFIINIPGEHGRNKNRP